MDLDRENMDRLLQLPQETEIWQLGFRQYSDWVTLAGRAWRPWMTTVFSLSHNTVVTALPWCDDRPCEDFLRSMLVRAMAHPDRPGLPHRPTELQLRDEDVADTLMPWLERLGIAYVVKDRLDAVEKVLAELGEEMYGSRSSDP